MTTEALAAPFPYFGGKRRAASAVWRALGDPGGYVEPFAGSAAVLLSRPAFTGRRVETLNDADGWLVNAWRAIQLAPHDVARYAWGPLTEVDYHARLAWLQDRRTDGLVGWLEGDPEVYDPKAAGWWLYVMAAGIGDPFGGGPWRVLNGRLTHSPDGGGVARGLPHLGDAGRGVNRELPSLGNAGRGVARDGALAQYLDRLAVRLARVRITCGDWSRVVQPSVTRAAAEVPGRAVFLDPPYVTSGDLYAHGDTDGGIADAVRAWCLSPQAEGLRVVLCGFTDDHDELVAAGWRKEAGRAGGGAGYHTDGAAGRRERLWLSPACLGDDLFAATGTPWGSQ